MQFEKYLIQEKRTPNSVGQEIEDLDMTVSNADRKGFDKMLNTALDKEIKRQKIDPDGDWTILSVISGMKLREAERLLMDLQERFAYDYSI